MPFFHLALCVVSCMVVTYMSHDILFTRETFSNTRT